MKRKLIFLPICMLLIISFSCKTEIKRYAQAGHEFNGSYTGENLNQIAFPMGGIGAGMVCLEGTGCLSHISVRHSPDLDNEPLTFAAITVKGEENTAKLIEGPVPDWKTFCKPESGNGLGVPLMDSQDLNPPVLRQSFPSRPFPSKTRKSLLQHS